MSAITFTDVTLRDGLQMESEYLPVEKKLELFKKILALGPNRMEITSFVNPKWVPQFQDAESFCQKLFGAGSLPLGGVELMAFVPNEQGLTRLLPFPIPWVSAFVAASESFNRKNVNRSIIETLDDLKQIVTLARRERRKTRIYVSTVFGCPYEGRVDDIQLFSVLKKVVALNPDEIALSDTIGVGVPAQMRRIIKTFAPLFDQKRTSLHLHNTYGIAMASALAGFEEGIRSFDGSTGGIGGCPYAKGATGNVALEELRYLFFREGGASTWNPKALFEATTLLESWKIPLHSQPHEILKKGGAIYGLG